jgi:hypothetical protein
LATRKLLIALLASTVLTWREWVEHHPPEIVIVGLLHLIFVLVAVGLLAYSLQWLGRNQGKPSSGPTKTQSEE